MPEVKMVNEFLHVEREILDTEINKLRPIDKMRKRLIVAEKLGSLRGVLVVSCQNDLQMLHIFLFGK